MTLKIKTPVKIVAKKLGISTQSVYAWKLGHYFPSIKNLKLLSRIEGVTMDKLIK